MSAVLTDAERAIFERRLGAARVELLPCPDDVPKWRRRHFLFVRCAVGGWRAEVQAQSLHQLDEPGAARTGALEHFACYIQNAAPDLFPVRA